MLTPYMISAATFVEDKADLLCQLQVLEGVRETLGM